MRVALIQLRQSPDAEENTARALAKIEETTANLIVLPESFTAPFGTEALGNYGDVLEKISSIAAKKEAYIVAGTVPEEEDGHFYNTAYVFGPDGSEVAKYRKIHLFDVSLSDISASESERYKNGEDLSTFNTPFGTVGLAVCYDLRFPGQFTALTDRGAEIIVVPAAFSKPTGERHWELLNRARALDSQCTLLSCAPAQADLPFPVYGHSMVVSPDGEVLASLDGDEGILEVEVDPSTQSIRESLPVTKTRRERGL